MSKNIDLSFCLPVYNVKPYLTACIESILRIKNTGISFEIVCIEDGSTDGTTDLLQQLSTQHPEIKVFINAKNSGVSHSRNRAIQEAKGNYIWFVDPDDMIRPEACQILLNVAQEQQADVVLANYTKIHQNDELPSAKPIGDFAILIPNTQEENWLTDSNGECRMYSSGRGLFLRQFLVKNNLNYNEKISYSEDTLFYLEFLHCDPRLIKCELSCYYVRQRFGSAMRSGGTKRKKIHHSAVALYQRYGQLLNENYDRNDISKRMYDLQEQIVKNLVSITDTAFVRSEFKELKQARIYPYGFRKENLKQKNIIIGFLYYLLPLPPVFWFFHYINKIKELPKKFR